MKNYIYKLFAVGTLLFLGASCEDDAELTKLGTVKFAAPVEASPSTIAITSANRYQSVTTISWPRAEYPVDAPVTYALQFDVAADTIGATGWQHAVRIVVGEEVLSKTFLGADLNDMAMDFGILPDVAGQLVVRVEATLDRTVYSDAIALNITPFFEVITLSEIYMPGDYQGTADPASAAVLPAIENGVFQGFITFPAGQLGFKFTTAPNWDESYGADSGGNFVQGGTVNFTAPAAGSYQITVNLNTMSYTLVPYSWGVIGTATAGGWNTDTDMVYDYTIHAWKFTGALVAGALKFRLNDAWTINYGSNNNDEGVAYLDNPGAHTITEAGNYVVTFFYDPEHTASAPYTVIQQ